MLFGRKKQQIGIERVPLEVATQRIFETKAEGVSVEKAELSDTSLAVLRYDALAKRLPPNLTQGQSYQIDVVDFMIVERWDLLVGNNLAFLGKNWLGPGRAVNSEFAYRQGDNITIGYFNETCSITDDRKVEVATEQDIFSLALPPRYDFEQLFYGAPKGFEKWVSRGNAEASTHGSRSSAHFGQKLAGKEI